MNHLNKKQAVERDEHQNGLSLKTPTLLFYPLKRGLAMKNSFRVIHQTKPCVEPIKSAKEME